MGDDTNVILACLGNIRDCARMAEGWKVLLEFMKVLAPFVSVIIAVALAWFAWATRRAERLKDAYGEWALVIYAIIGHRAQSPWDPEGNPLPYATEDPDEWEKERLALRAKARGAVVLLLTREPHSACRAFVTDMTGLLLHEEDNVYRQEEATERVGVAIQEAAKKPWLLMWMRSPDFPKKALKERPQTYRGLF